MSGDPVEPQPFTILPRGLAPLGYRNYLLYWIGWIASNTGKWAELTGSLWLVFELTKSPVLLGLIGLWRAVPSMVLSPFAGVVADRVDQRKLMLTTQTLGLCASAALAALVILGLVEVWHVYVQVAIQASVTAFDSAARQALFPKLIPRNRLHEAVTLSVTAGRTSKLLGPALGGLAIAGFGEAAPYLLNCGSFLVLMVAVLGLKGVTRVAGRTDSFRGQLTEGLRYVLQAPVLRGLIQLEIVYSIFSMNEAMITIIGLQVLGVGPSGLGVLLSAPALGSLVGIASLIVLRPPARPGRFIIWSTLIYAAAVAAAGLVREFWPVMLALIATGLLDAYSTVTRHSIMQLAAPADMRGRVMANMGTITQGMAPVANTQSGFLSGLIGVPFALAVSGGALAVAATRLARSNRRLWDFARDAPAADGHDASGQGAPAER